VVLYLVIAITEASVFLLYGFNINLFYSIDLYYQYLYITFLAVNSREPPVLLNYSQLLQKAEMESTQSQDNNIDTLHGEQVPVDYVTPPPDTLTSFPNSDHSIDPIPYGPVPHDPDTDNEHINRLPDTSSYPLVYNGGDVLGTFNPSFEVHVIKDSTQEDDNI
jgi:hypothetical protein